MSISELISGILQPFFDLFPRIEQRPAEYEWLVVETWWGGAKSRRSPVLHVPAITHVERYPRSEYPIDAGFQSLVTADGTAVTANATAIVFVDDPILLRTQVSYHNWEEWVAMLVRGAVKDVLSCHNFAHLQDDAEALIEDFLCGRLSQAGIFIEQLVLEDFTPTRPFRLFVQPVGD